MLTSRSDAYLLLEELGAPDRLVRHAELVSQAADSLLIELRSLGVSLDVLIVELGAVLHGCGKIVHPEELSGAGSLHEHAGQLLLLAHGVQSKVARCCVSHGAWNLPDVSLEEHVVALADKLWKGKREVDLELLVVDEVALRLGVSRWDVFDRLDTAFEEIAAEGPSRIVQSRLSRQ